MAGLPAEHGEPVTDKRQLIAYHEGGCKPREQWRIGTEHEKFVYRLRDLHPLPYEGSPGIREVLERLQRFGWTPHSEAGRPIALTQGRCAITLEPGGQLELSGEPLENLHQTCEEVGEHLRQVKAIATETAVGVLGVGFQPKWSRAETPWMPKGRYALMRRYLPGRGAMALDMMLRTCAIQVNLDYASESEMVKKFRVGLALQPIATALFANSPFVDGAPSGYLSYRARVWRDTDPDRCGFPRFVFEPGMGFERYVDAVLDVPMLFVYREGRYLDAAGQSFRDFLDRRLHALSGEVPTLGDWSDHLTTIFYEVRMKRFLEMRGADGGPWARLCALPAFWVGLFYDSGILDEAADMVADWTPEEIDRLHAQVSHRALAAEFRGRRVLEWAREALAMSRTGLTRRQRVDRNGQDENQYLAVLEESAENDRVPAEDLLEAYATRWRQSVNPLFREYAY